jgi:hypothetical protein
VRRRVAERQQRGERREDDAEGEEERARQDEDARPLPAPGQPHADQQERRQQADRHEHPAVDHGVAAHQRRRDRRAWDGCLAEEQRGAERVRRPERPAGGEIEHGEERRDHRGAGDPGQDSLANIGRGLDVGIGGRGDGSRAGSHGSLLAPPSGLGRSACAGCRRTR